MCGNSVASSTHSSTETLIKIPPVHTMYTKDLMGIVYHARNKTMGYLKEDDEFGKILKYVTSRTKMVHALSTCTCTVSAAAHMALGTTTNLLASCHGFSCVHRY